MALWTPSKIDTALWLDAADADTITLNSGSVSQWDDKSENNRHAWQSGSTAQPFYDDDGFNGLPTLSFDGLNDALMIPDSWGSHTSHSFFAVVSPPNSGDRKYVFSAGHDVGNNPALLLIAARNNTEQVGYYDGNSWRGTSAATSGEQILEWVLDGAASSGKTYRNGDELQTLTYSVNTLQNGIAVGARLGSSTQNFFAGLISEIVVLPSAADTNTRQKIEGYLAWKWGLEANLPAEHPYKAAAPAVETPTGLIVAFTTANSITWGWDG